MTIRAVFFDLGGVIVRTEYQAPREHLAQRLGLNYDELVSAVFESRTSRQASLGAMDAQAHWEAVIRTLGLPAGQREAVRTEFFAGDVVDLSLVNYLRSLRPRWRTGLISNAWSDLRAYITSQGFADAFDQMAISAEVGVVKPEAGIYRIALEQAGVSPGEAVFVDDFIENVQGAQAVGMQAIHFVQPEQALEELELLLNPP